MVYKDNLRPLSDKEKSQYKFESCELCEFYECELVREYMQFEETHVKIPNTEEHLGSSLILKADADSLKEHEKEGWGSVLVLQGESVSLKDYEEEGRDSGPILQGMAVSLKDCEEEYAHVTSCHSGDEENICEMLSYDQEKSCYIKNSEIVDNRIECGNKNVTDGIGDHYKIEIDYNWKIKTNTKDRWEPFQPVFISAQTGSGKNYFVEHVLIPYLDELNYRMNTTYKILILSNRWALKRQIEERIKKNDDTDSADSWLYSYGDCDNADVMTYQSLLNKTGYFEKRQKQKDSRYVFVICDEAHFFTSDAMFNPHTQKILSAIVKLFKDGVRVYMSATPYECLEYIVKTEEELNSHYKQMVFYHFKRDYSYLDIKAYSDIKELYDEIVKSVSKGKKWLIFIDDKRKCRDVKAELEKYGDDNECPMFTKKDETKIPKIYAVDADGKEDGTYRSIIRNEKLGQNTYVLISTSVLDNGVNLGDIDNIVISDMSKVKSLQMVGRARAKKDGIFERKILYIKRFDKKHVKGRLGGFYNQRKAYRDYGAAYIGPEDLYPKSYNKYDFINKYYEGDKEDWENAKHWFGSTPEKPDELYLNEIAQSLLDKFISQYEFIFNEMETESKSESGGIYVPGQKYLDYQFSWFGEKYNTGTDITLVDKKESQKELLKFLERCADVKIAKEEQDAFSEEFTNLYDAAFQREDPNKDRNYGIDKMNKLLAKRKLGYIIGSIGTPVEWVVKKVSR